MRERIPDVDARIKDALEALSAKPSHDPDTGRFVPGGLAAGKTLERSTQLWGAVAETKRELVEQVRRDSGLNGNTAATLAGLQEAYAEARLFRSAMFVRLVETGGPLTGKGRIKALYTGYLNALDREMKLAQTLGLERRARQVSTDDELNGYLAQARAEEGSENP